MLARHLAYDYPQYFPYFGLSGFNYKGAWYPTHDNLIGRYEGADGIKTGYTGASGFNLVSSVTRGNTHVIAVVMGGRTALRRDLEMVRLLDQTFAPDRRQSHPGRRPRCPLAACGAGLRAAPGRLQPAPGLAARRWHRRRRCRPQCRPRMKTPPNGCARRMKHSRPSVPKPARLWLPMPKAARPLGRPPPRPSPSRCCPLCPAPNPRR